MGRPGRRHDRGHQPRESGGAFQRGREDGVSLAAQVSGVAGRRQADGAIREKSLGACRSQLPQALLHDLKAEAWPLSRDAPPTHQTMALRATSFANKRASLPQNLERLVRMSIPTDGRAANSTTDRPHFAALDAIRGLAALSVVAYHVSWLNPTASLNYVKNSYVMVDVFFVLSGFVIFYSYSGKLGTVGGVRRFVWRRFWRLYPLHFTFLIVTLLIEALKFVLVWRHVMNVNHPAFAENNMSAFVKNLFLVQALHTTDQDTFNIPAWSISTEFCAYLVFATAAFVSPTRAVLLTISCVICTTNFLFLIALGPLSTSLTYDFGIVRCLVGFFLGVLLYALHDRARATSFVRMNARLFGGIVVVSLLVFIAFLSSKGHVGYADLCIYPLSAAVILPAALAPEASAARFLYSRPLQWLGRVSYSVYMVHYAVLWFVKGALRVVTHAQDVALPYQQEPTLLASPLAGTLALIIGVALVLLIAHLTYAWIEMPFRNWSRRPVMASVPPAGKLREHNLSVTD
jgi:peptidoglycan/LPS O-acetylase OafA/YrhL